MADTSFIEDAIPYAGPIVSLISGLFGPSAESQYNEANKRNLERSIRAIRADADLRRARVQRLADRQQALAVQSGSRRASFQGGTADPSVYTDPDVSRIHQNLSESMTQIGESEQSGILNATAGVRDMPSYMFPQGHDYLSTALGAASDILGAKQMFGYQRDLENRRLESQDALTRALSGGGSSKGVDFSEGLDAYLKQQRQNRMRL